MSICNKSYIEMPLSNCLHGLGHGVLLRVAALPFSPCLPPRPSSLRVVDLVHAENLCMESSACGDGLFHAFAKLSVDQFEQWPCNNVSSASPCFARLLQGKPQLFTRLRCSSASLKHRPACVAASSYFAANSYFRFNRTGLEDASIGISPFPWPFAQNEDAFHWCFQIVQDTTLNTYHEHILWHACAAGVGKAGSWWNGNQHFDAVRYCMVFDNNALNNSTRESVVDACLTWINPLNSFYSLAPCSYVYTSPSNVTNATSCLGDMMQTT